MGKILIQMTSITYAMKAKDLLNQKRIYCEIEKTPKNIGSGCGYSIRIKDSKNYILKILDENKIPHKEAFDIFWNIFGSDYRMILHGFSAKVNIALKNFFIVLLPAEKGGKVWNKLLTLIILQPAFQNLQA